MYAWKYEIYANTWMLENIVINSGFPMYYSLCSYLPNQLQSSLGSYKRAKFMVSLKTLNGQTQKCDQQCCGKNPQTFTY